MSKLHLLNLTSLYQVINFRQNIIAFEWKNNKKTSTTHNYFYLILKVDEHLFCYPTCAQLYG